MMRIRQHLLGLMTALVVLAGGSVAQAFSLLGPFTPWQTSAIGYNLVATEQGGPMDIGEDYRVSLPFITYGFDESFLTFFGTAGVQAIDNAFQVLNSLPTASQINLASYPPGNAALLNFRAQTLGIRDLKSTVLALMVEQLGLANPVRYTWTLRDVQPNFNNTATNYWVVRRNFDPVSRFYSSYVNGTLYTYQIRSFTTPAAYLDAVELTADPAEQNDQHLPVAARLPGVGEFYTGLTQDDVGGLKFLLSSSRYRVQTLDSSVSNYFGAPSPWLPYAYIGGSNAFATNVALITTGVRGGAEKITFQKLQIDSLLGLPTTVTNIWTDRVRSLTNNFFTNQVVMRVTTNVDILFAAEDLGLDPVTFSPIPFTRSAMSFVNNAALNQNPAATPLNGPGDIQLGGAGAGGGGGGGGGGGAVLVSFNRIGEFIVNSNFLNPFLNEANATRAFVWGSFDGSAREPIVYPNTLSLAELERQIGLRR